MSAAPTYDVVVVGVGAAGSAALLALADRGLRVLGVDRFAPGHDRGSSHGASRIIRTAYFEHPDYVPLLQRAWAGWARVEERSGASLLRRTGLVEVGPPDGEVVPGVLAAARLHGLAVEELSGEDVADRWPALALADGLTAVFEEAAGVLRCEAAVETQAALAVEAGAELWTDTVVEGWEPDGDGLRVRTSAGDVRTDRLVVTAGAWAAGLLADLGVPLTVRRKQLHWYADHDAGLHVDAGFPIFFHELEHGQFYGFPAMDGRGMKVAEHTGGTPVVDPASLDRDLDRARADRVDAYVRDHLRGVRGPVTEHAACMYTDSPDGHFVVDRHPQDERVVLAAGLSGHGFKFAPALGELLADLAVDGRSDLPHEFLGLARF